MTAPTDEELRKLAEAATPGEWKARAAYGPLNRVRASDGMLLAELSNSDWPGENAEANTRFIAAANPAVILGLLDQLEAARGALKEVARHVHYLRHVEKRYREVGKTKYDFAKLNGPLAAIERALARLEAE